MYASAHIFLIDAEFIRCGIVSMLKIFENFLIALFAFYLLLPLLLYSSFPLLPQLLSSVPLLCLLENPKKENTLKKSLREIYKYIFFLYGGLFRFLSTFFNTALSATPQIPLCEKMETNSGLLQL
jgi:hypothetical protein